MSTGDTPATTAPGTTAATDSAGHSDSGTTGDADSGGVSTGDPPPLPCAAGSLPPGRYAAVELEFGGVTRRYDLLVPETADVTEPAPLVLNFHGLLGTPAQQAMFSQFDAAATEAGAIVAYPAGIGNSWNSAQCCGDAFAQGVDDVGFARTVVAHVGLRSCVDPARVYAIGMSNGGHMAHLLACQAADLFAGAASVAGVLGLAPAACKPARPISMLQFHGTGDNIVPYDGIGPGYPNVRTMMEGWADRNGCAPVPNVTHEQGDSTCETWIACDDEVDVTLCTVDGGGHCWPGNASCTFGQSTTDVSANDIITAMMATQSLD